MTNEEISKLEAGPELDALVISLCFPECTVGVAAIGPDNEDVPAVWKWKGERDWIPLPKVSTYDSQALEVVDKLLAGPFEGDFHLEVLNGIWGASYCYIESENTWDDWMRGPTRALAISRLAVRVMQP